jgi:hypothetical protein
MDFDVAPVDGAVTFITAMTETSRIAERWLNFGAGLEQSSLVKADAAYRNSIAADAGLEDAHLTWAPCCAK